MKTLLIALLFTSSFAQAARFIVEANHKLSAAEIKNIKGMKVQLFAEIDDPYFSRLYTVSGKVTKEQIAKQNWVKNIEDTVELTRLALEPSPNPDRLVTDELFPYQWGLLNQGQTYVREKDDIHNIPLVGIEGKDISWRSIYNKMPKERPIVAVLDSGVDLKHPDLQGNLWTNAGECGKDPSIDNDGNGVPGDCRGWDFTKEKTSEEAKDPGDIDGHGTHVAGIIAAASNGIGIVGVNPNALIMPVKVMRDSDAQTEVAASESFALGILYATKMGAQVINLSLGWPRSLETNHLRNAVAYALSKNVILVAAAGNNNSSEPLFPCAYDRVICAAASTLDGSFAGFSNFGSHIDAIAPGEGILSLYPIEYEPDFFTVPGYDIKSGTSQSAPALAGLISILKAKKPDVTIDEVFARLYSGANNPDKKKFILGGIASWDSLNRDIAAPVVRPVLKRVYRKVEDRLIIVDSQIVIRGEEKEGNFSLPLRNYGTQSSEVLVKVESLSKGIEFPETPMSLPPLGPSELKELFIPYKVSDFNSESSLQIKITLSDAQGERSFLHNLPVLRDVRAEAGYKKSTFKFADKPFPLGNVKDGKILKYLRTVDSFGKDSLSQLYVRRNIEEEKKIELSLFTRKGNVLEEAPRKIIVENALSLTNFIRVDLNMDGKEDYLIQSVSEDTNGKFYVFSFYNSELKPLWESFPSAKYTIDLAIGELKRPLFTRIDHPKLGKMMMPAFFTQGQLPKIDQTQDFFQRWDGSQELRLYYLEPQIESKSLRIRALTTKAWKDQVKKQLNSNWYETVLVENVLPVSVSDSQKGELRVVVSVGQGTRRSFYITTFETTKTNLSGALPQIVLQTEGVDTLFSVTPSGLDAVGDVFLNVYDRSRAKIVTTENTAQTSQLNYSHVSETDIVVGHIVSFQNKNKRTSIIQTRDELISLSTIDGKVTKTTRPKLRYSFFSSQVLSEMYNPVIYKRNGVQSPALYVDSTAVTANRVYLFEEQNGKLVSSIRNSLIVPGNCQALNPAFNASTNVHEFVFMCVEDKQWVIRTYDMN